MALKFGHLDEDTSARIRFFVAALFFGQDPTTLG
jgi:hypothetical protein